MLMNPKANVFKSVLLFSFSSVFWKEKSGLLKSQESVHHLMLFYIIPHYEYCVLI